MKQKMFIITAQNTKNTKNNGVSIMCANINSRQATHYYYRGNLSKEVTNKTNGKANNHHKIKNKHQTPHCMITSYNKWCCSVCSMYGKWTFYRTVHVSCTSNIIIIICSNVRDVLQCINVSFSLFQVDVFKLLPVM